MQEDNKQDNKQEDKIRPFSVVILAAGKGTRMNTPNLPKVLHKLNNKCLIDYVVETARDLNPDQIIVVVGYQHQKVINHLKFRYPNLTFAFQEVQLGTAHAVEKAIPLVKINNPLKRVCQEEDPVRTGIHPPHSINILVLSGDVPLIKSETLNQMLIKHSTSKSIFTFMTTKMENPTGLGRIIRNSQTNLFEKIIEEKDITDPEEKKITEINAGIYILDWYHILRVIPSIRNNNQQQEYYLPDAINIFHQKADNPGKAINIFENSNSLEIQGINTIEQLQELEQTTLNRDKHKEKIKKT